MKRYIEKKSNMDTSARSERVSISPIYSQTPNVSLDHDTQPSITKSQDRSRDEISKPFTSLIKPATSNVKKKTDVISSGFKFSDQKTSDGLLLSQQKPISELIKEKNKIEEEDSILKPIEPLVQTKIIESNTFISSVSEPKIAEEIKPPNSIGGSLFTKPQKIESSSTGLLFSSKQKENENFKSPDQEGQEIRGTSFFLEKV